MDGFSALASRQMKQILISDTQKSGSSGSAALSAIMKDWPFSPLMSTEPGKEMEKGDAFFKNI